MAYTAPPVRTALSDTYPAPSNSVFKAGIAALWDFATGLLGTSGNPEGAFDALKLIDQSNGVWNLKPIFTFGSGAMTCTMKGNDAADLSATNPAYVHQRHATLSDGTTVRRKMTANLSLVVPSGATLGHIDAKIGPLYWYIIDNAGAQELAVTSSFMGETGVYSTTAISAGSDSEGILYSTSARSNVAGRLAFLSWDVQTTAGTWSAAPTEVKSGPLDTLTVGEIVDYGGGVVPYGCFLMDGSNQSRATYAKLFSRIGTTFGVGDGSTTFGIGDSRRRVLVGSGGTGTGTLGNVVGNVGGAETHTLVTAEMPGHTHPLGLVASGGAGTLRYSFTPGGTTDTAPNILAETTGGGGAHNNLSPSMVVTKMIRWLGDF